MNKTLPEGRPRTAFTNATNRSERQPKSVIYSPQTALGPRKEVPEPTEHRKVTPNHLHRHTITLSRASLSMISPIFVCRSRTQIGPGRPMRSRIKKYRLQPYWNTM